MIKENDTVVFRFGVTSRNGQIETRLTFFRFQDGVQLCPTTNLWTWSQFDERINEFGQLDVQLMQLESYHVF